MISSGEARELLDSMDLSSVVGLRDRAIIAVMAFSFARVSAVVGLKVEDCYPQKKRWWLCLREKNGKVNEMPCHHKLEAYLDAYIEAAGIGDDRTGPLFRAALGKTKILSARPLSRRDVWYMIRRRADDMGLETAHRLSYVSRDRHHGLSDEWRADRDRAAHGGTRQRENHRA